MSLAMDRLHPPPGKELTSGGWRRIVYFRRNQPPSPVILSTVQLEGVLTYALRPNDLRRLRGVCRDDLRPRGLRGERAHCADRESPGNVRGARQEPRRQDQPE